MTLVPRQEQVWKVTVTALAHSALESAVLFGIVAAVEPVPNFSTSVSISLAALRTWDVFVPSDLVISTRVLLLLVHTGSFWIYFVAVVKVLAAAAVVVVVVVDVVVVCVGVDATEMEKSSVAG